MSRRPNTILLLFIIVAEIWHKITNQYATDQTGILVEIFVQTFTVRALLQKGLLLSHLCNVVMALWLCLFELISESHPTTAMGKHLKIIGR